MAEAVYTLVFQGELLEGFEREQVMQSFAELFGLKVEDVARVFGSSRVVLKRNLRESAAHAYRERLAGIGMVVRLDESAAPAVAPAAAAVSSHAPTVLALETPAAPPAPAAAPAPAQAAAAEREDAGVRQVPFEFSGQGFEFFRIWIVNLLLTIVTLGIYSAWAKVRTQRYFYGNTRLDGASFEYLASPLSILKGRLVAFAMLLVYLLASEFVPLLEALLMLCFIAIMPWVIVRGLAFRNHYSAWRGVRFGFDGRVGESYKVFLLWPLLGMLTLGLLFPYAFYRQQRFIIENTRYGVVPFTFGAGAGSFYKLFGIVIGFVLLGAIIAGVLGSLIFAPLSIILMIGVYLVAMALFAVRLTNLRFNNTAIDCHATAAGYTLGSYTALMLTNTLAIVLTLGLFYPWAKVRSARYAAAHIALDADGDLDRFAADQSAAVSAVGGEIGDLFDVDMGF